MNLKTMIGSFVAFREECDQAPRFDLAKARDRPHAGRTRSRRRQHRPVIALIAPPGRNRAHAAIDGARLPARDVEPLVLLIADPRHVMHADGTIRLSRRAGEGILDLKASAVDGAWPRRDRRRSQEAGEAIQDYLDILRSRAGVLHIVPHGARRDPQRIRRAATHRTRRCGGEVEDER